MRKIYWLVVLLGLVLLAGCSTGPRKYDKFAQCLTENGVVIFGTEWCSHCKNQKEMFGKSFEYIDYVDCDKYKDECLRNSIEGYPTWKINNQNYPGEQQLYQLASLTGCELEEDSTVCDIEGGVGC